MIEEGLAAVASTADGADYRRPRGRRRCHDVMALIVGETTVER